MKMKTSPKDVSNNVILKEFLKVSKKVDTLDVSNKEIMKELKELTLETKRLSASDASVHEELKKLSADVGETMEAVYELSKHTDEGFIRLNSRVSRIESVVVTKDYLDDKLADLHSDLVRYTKKEIEKSLR